MLVLSRKEDQSIVFPNLGISIEIVRVQGNKVCVGVEAPKAIRVVRGELQSVADQKDKLSSPEFQLGQFMEVLPAQTRNELREHLNVAGLAVHTAQKQCELGGLENAEFFLAKAVDALAQLNKMFEVSQAADPSDCVKEPQSGYSLARRDAEKPAFSLGGDRGLDACFPQPVIPHQLLQYLQHRLCSYN